MVEQDTTTNTSGEEGVAAAAFCVQHGRQRGSWQSTSALPASKGRLGLHFNPSTSPQSSWRTIIPNTCKAPRISEKRGRPHGCAAVRWLELTERAGRVARPRYLLEPSAGGRGVAETIGGNMASSSCTANRRPGWPHCGTEVSSTSCPCDLCCPACPLADVSDACHRPRVQEMVSEAS